MARWIGLGLASASMLVGCGRVHFDETAADPPAADVAPASGPFGNIVQIPELDSLGADDPALTGDELEIVFTSDRIGGVGTCDVWMSTRGSTGASWSPPMSIGAPVNTTVCDAGGFLSRDGLTLWLGTRVGGAFDLFEARRATRTSPWQTPQALGPLNTTTAEIAPTVTADQLIMVFDSNRSGVSRLYLSTRAAVAAPWDPPAIVGPLTAGTSERSPHVSADGLRLSFVSNATGSRDLWVASRPDRASPFGAPAVLTELVSADDEDDPWLSDDEHRIYFARYPSVGTPTLWAASR